MNRSPSYVIEGDRTGSRRTKEATDDHLKNKGHYAQPEDAEEVSAAAAKVTADKEAKKRAEAAAAKKAGNK